MAQEPQQTIHRIAQMKQFAKDMSDQELWDAADLLGRYPARWEARQARADVLAHLSARGYDTDEGAQLDAGATGEVDAPPGAYLRTAGRRGVANTAFVVRLVGAGLLAITALAIWLAMAPDEVPSQTETISQALRDYEENDAATEGAPQQAVVNGWVARDLLAVLAVQADRTALAEQQASDRLAAEEVVIVVAIAFGIATSGWRRE